MDVDQELTNLEDGIRRLKIEYEIFFNGGWSIERKFRRGTKTSLQASRLHGIIFC